MFTIGSKQGSMITEKRKQQRHRLSLPVFCWSSAKEFRPNWVMTKDISQNGICLRTCSSIAKGAKMRMEIEIPGRLFLVKALGQVKWIKTAIHPDRAQASPQKEIGLHIVFAKPLDAEIWRKYIHRSTMLPSLAN